MKCDRNGWCKRRPEKWKIRSLKTAVSEGFLQKVAFALGPKCYAQGKRKVVNIRRPSKISCGLHSLWGYALMWLDLMTLTFPQEYPGCCAPFGFGVEMPQFCQSLCSWLRDVDSGVQQGTRLPETLFSVPSWPVLSTRDNHLPLGLHSLLGPGHRVISTE